MNRRKVSRSAEAAFSLLELLTVVAIILIITAIAVPRFLRARATASESAAASTMRSLNTAIFMYVDVVGVYPPAISNLGGTTPCVRSATTGCAMEDSTAKLISGGTYSGYSWAYALAAAPASGFTVTADPLAGNGATRHFFLDDQGVIKYSDTGAASASSPPLGN